MRDGTGVSCNNTKFALRKKSFFFFLINTPPVVVKLRTIYRVPKKMVLTVLPLSLCVAFGAWSSLKQL